MITNSKRKKKTSILEAEWAYTTHTTKLHYNKSNITRVNEAIVGAKKRLPLILQLLLSIQMY